MKPEELANAAADWFGSLGAWPEEAVVDVALQNRQGKCAGPGYYGVTAVLLMLVAVNDGHWPPMTPAKFAADLRDPSHHEQIARYAKTVETLDLQWSNS